MKKTRKRSEQKRRETIQCAQFDCNHGASRLFCGNDYYEVDPCGRKLLLCEKGLKKAKWDVDSIGREANLILSLDPNPHGDYSEITGPVSGSPRIHRRRGFMHRHADSPVLKIDGQNMSVTIRLHEAVRSLMGHKDANCRQTHDVVYAWFEN